MSLEITNVVVAAEMGFQGEHLVLLDERLDRIVCHGVFQVAKDARFCRADLHAGRFQSPRDAVIAQRAFLRRFGFRIQEAAAVRAGLDAKAAADAIIRIHQDRAVRRVERRAHRAHLRAGRGFAQIAQLGDEE